jgi:cytidylate kinase
VEQRQERTDPLYYRLIKSFMRGSYEGSLNAPKLNLVDSENIVKFSQRVVLHAASSGDCVIVGRGSQLFLSNRPDTFRVFLYAPREEKVRRLLSRGKSEREAQELVDTVDHERAGFLEKYFHVVWPDRALYHVMLNTAIGDEMVVQTIANCMRSCDSKSIAQ